MDIERPPYDSSAHQYTLAGQLIGSEWVFENGRMARVEGIDQIPAREDGHRKWQPVVVVSDGRQLPVDIFESKIIPTVGPSNEPANGVAKEIVEALRPD